MDTAFSSAGIPYYLSAAPRGASLPYIILDAQTETEDGARYQQRGSEQTQQVKCWADNPWDAQEVYNTAKGALQGVTHAVTGHKLVTNVMEILTSFKEQDAPADEPGPYCVVGRWVTRTVVG